MTEKAHSRTSRNSAKARSKKPVGILTTFPINRDPIEALSGFKLLAGAEVAIVSSSPSDKSVRSPRSCLASHGGALPPSSSYPQCTKFWPRTALTAIQMSKT